MDCVKCKKSIPEDALFCPYCGKKLEKTSSPKTRPNGTGTVFKREGAKTWTASVVHGYIIQENGKKKVVRSTKSGFKTKKEAMEYLPILKNEPKRKIPTLQELFEVFKAGNKYAKLGKSQKGKYEIAWKKIEPLWFWKIDLLTTFDMQNMVDSAADTYYTARDIKDLFSKLYQMAMPDKFVAANLSKFIELPPLNAKEQQPFREDEVQKLWLDYDSGNWWTGYILLMIYTGMMPGELLDARKDNIDWEGKQIIGAGKKTEKRRETPIVLNVIKLRKTGLHRNVRFSFL